MDLTEQLLMERKLNYKGGLYHTTQILMTYNTNAIEGSTLTEEHTRTLFETRTLIANKDEIFEVDDIKAAQNHFRAFNYILTNAKKPLTEDMLKKVHELVTEGTYESYQEYFNVREYKSTVNTIGGYIETTPPEKVPQEMKFLVDEYSKKENITVDDIVDFHYKFESIHPFQNGNGRVGRLIMFKECLAHNHVPILIPYQYKAQYLNGLAKYKTEKGFLRETCLFGQDMYKNHIKNLSLKPKKEKSKGISR